MKQQNLIFGKKVHFLEGNKLTEGVLVGAKYCKDTKGTIYEIEHLGSIKLLNEDQFSHNRKDIITHFNLFYPKSISKRVEELAKRKSISTTKLIVEAIEKYVDCQYLYGEVLLHLKNEAIMELENGTRTIGNLEFEEKLDKLPKSRFKIFVSPKNV